MRNTSKWLKALMTLGLLFTFGASLNVNAGLFGFGATSWKEEALLHDGSKLIVERTVELGGHHEIGQEPPIKEQSLTFTMPGSNQRVVWKDEFSEDVGSANFLPMQLEIAEDIAYLVVTPMGCLSYNKWGRPNPPYVVFKYQGNAWKRISLQELPSEFKEINLAFSSPDHAAKEAIHDLLTAEQIKKWNSNARQPQYQSILREPIPSGGQGRCIKTNYYGTAGWLSPDWFTDQQSLGACLKFCDQKRINTEICPCNSIFKGK